MFYTVEMAEEAGWQDDYAQYFAAFMNAVNARVQAATGMNIDCFPDWDWAEAFNSGDSVDDVALQFLEDVWEGNTYA